VDGKFPTVDSYWGSQGWGYGRNWDGRTSSLLDGKVDPLWAGYGTAGLYGGAWGGRLVDGKWTDSKFEGKWVDGKWVEGKNVDGKWIDGKFTCVENYWGGANRWDLGRNWDGRSWEGRNWDGRTSSLVDAKVDPLWAGYGYNGLYGNQWGGRLVDGKWTDSKFEGRWVDGKWVEGKNVDGKWIDGKFPVIDSSNYWGTGAGSRWWDNKYNTTNTTSYPYNSTSSYYPYARLSTNDPLTVAANKSDKAGYVRQYTNQPECQQAEVQSNASRKASHQHDDERFDFDNEKKN